MTVAPPRADAAMELGRSFRAAVASLRRLRGREQQSPGELSDAQYGLLFGLRERAQMPLRELAELADLSPPSATEMLEALEAAGLVHRERSQLDRRVVLTSLTARGRFLVEARREQFEPKWRRALSGFSRDELVIAGAVLDRLREMFDELAAERARDRAVPRGNPGGLGAGRGSGVQGAARSAK